MDADNARFLHGLQEHCSSVGVAIFSHQQPPSEISLGSVAQILASLLQGNRDARGLSVDLHSSQCHVFLLPPKHFCVPSPQHLSSLEALTCVYSTCHRWPRNASKFRAHMEESWILTVRMKTQRDRGNRPPLDHDVAFVLFHLRHGKLLVEFLCVADGTQSTPKKSDADGSHRNCGLELFLIDVVQRLLVVGFVGTTFTMAAWLGSDDPLLGTHVDMFHPATEGAALTRRPVPSELLFEDHWSTVVDHQEHRFVLPVEGGAPSVFARNQAAHSVVTDVVARPLQPPLQLERAPPPTPPDSPAENSASRASASAVTAGEIADLDMESFHTNEEGCDYDFAPTPPASPAAIRASPALASAHTASESADSHTESVDADDEGSEDDCAPDLQALAKMLFENLADGDAAALTDVEFQTIAERYDKNMMLPLSCPLPELHDDLESFVAVKLDIDSGLAHGPTPFTVVSSFRSHPNCSITIFSPDRVKRNDKSTRIHVKPSRAFRPSYKDGSSPKTIDMAKFPNFELGKVCVSDCGIEFTLNLHLLQENLGSLGQEIYIITWNAALNSARNNYRASSAYVNCDDESIKADLASRLNDSCEFELKSAPGESKDVSSRPQNICFKHLTGCLFLQIVWEQLHLFGTEGLGPIGQEHRAGNWLHSSEHEKKQIEKAAVELFHHSHTVMQAAGFRHKCHALILDQPRPLLSQQRAFHGWLNLHYQSFMKAAVANFFIPGVTSNVFTSLDLGINFFSRSDECFVLINGYKAQRIVNQQTMVRTEDARSYYSNLQDPDSIDEPVAAEMDAPSRPNPSVPSPRNLVGQGVCHVRPVFCHDRCSAGLPRRV